MSSGECGNRWTAELVAEFERACPTAAEFALRLPWTSECGEQSLAVGALLARVASLYGGGSTPDEISERIERGGGGVLDRGEALALTMDVAQAVRGGLVPGPFWWEPHLLVAHLATHWARTALPERGEAITSLLGARLWLPPDQGCSDRRDGYRAHLLDL